MEEILQQILCSIQEIKKSIGNTTEDRFLTRKEVEEEYDFTTLEVSKLFKAAGFPVINIGRTQKVSKKSLENFLNAGIKIKIKSDGRKEETRL